MRIPTRLQWAAYIGRSFVSRSIQLATRAGLEGPSHVAIRDSQTGAVYEAWEPNGVRVISHLGEGHAPGTRVDLFNWPLSDEDVSRVISFFLGEVGCKYDFRGIASFILKTPRDDPEKWFCSEINTAAGLLTANPVLVRCAPRSITPIASVRSPVLLYQSSVRTTKHGHQPLERNEPLYL